MIIAGNWKMHKTVKEAKTFIEAFIPKVKDAKNQILVAAPFTAISACAEIASGSNIQIGAQNMAKEKEGAFTGEISISMLLDVGAKFVILGHSERRHLFQETNADINQKLQLAIENNLPAIVCVGEKLEERESGKTIDVLKKQLNGSLKGVTDFSQITIAYEPVWAIGTGKVATPEIAEEAHLAIRNHLGTKTPILYGGSVKPNNIQELLKQPDIDGALIGGASLDVEAFTQMGLS